MNKFELGQHTDEGTNHCRHCGATFYHTNDTIDICRYCWGSGKADEERLKPLLTELGCVDANVSIMNTGGNCMAIMVPMGDLPDGAAWFTRYCYLTQPDGDLPDDDGMSEGQRWVIGYYVDDDCEESVPDDWSAKGLTLAEALEYLWARRAVEQIRDDMAEGTLQNAREGAWKPQDGFEALHSYVDANMYLESCMFYDSDSEAGFARCERVTAMIEARLGELA